MNLELALVVKRQHFDLHRLQEQQRHRPEQQQRHHHQEHPLPSRVVNQRGHHPPVQPRCPVFLLTVDLLGVGRPVLRALRPAQDPVAAQGVTTNATTIEKIIAALEPIGIGRMYGPINPLTNAIGKIAAITVRVARITDCAPR